MALGKACTAFEAFILLFQRVFSGDVCDWSRNGCEKVVIFSDFGSTGIPPKNLRMTRLHPFTLLMFLEHILISHIKYFQSYRSVT